MADAEAKDEAGADPDEGAEPPARRPPPEGPSGVILAPFGEGEGDDVVKNRQGEEVRHWTRRDVFGLIICG